LWSSVANRRPPVARRGSRTIRSAGFRPGLQGRSPMSGGLGVTPPASLRLGARTEPFRQAAARGHGVGDPAALGDPVADLPGRPVPPVATSAVAPPGPWRGAQGRRPPGAAQGGSARPPPRGHPWPQRPGRTRPRPGRRVPLGPIGRPRRRWRARLQPRDLGRSPPNSLPTAPVTSRSTVHRPAGSVRRLSRPERCPDGQPARHPRESVRDGTEWRTPFSVTT
jgi:hypothetical protein